MKGQWRKSTYSDAANGCVEIANTFDAIRDSKDPNGPVLVAPVRSLVEAVKADRFQR